MQGRILDLGVVCEFCPIPCLETNPTQYLGQNKLGETYMMATERP